MRRPRGARAACLGFVRLAPRAPAAAVRQMCLLGRVRLRRRAPVDASEALIGCCGRRRSAGCLRRDAATQWARNGSSSWPKKGAGCLRRVCGELRRDAANCGELRRVDAERLEQRSSSGELERRARASCEQSPSWLRAAAPRLLCAQLASIGVSPTGDSASRASGTHLALAAHSHTHSRPAHTHAHLLIYLGAGRPALAARTANNELPSGGEKKYDLPLDAAKVSRRPIFI